MQSGPVLMAHPVYYYRFCRWNKIKPDRPIITANEVAADWFFWTVWCQGAISGIGVKVPYTGITDTTADTFAKCRVEVREYLRQFANWPRSTDLLPRLGGCPAVTFAAPYEFDTRRSVCALAPWNGCLPWRDTSTPPIFSTAFSDDLAALKE